MLPILRLYYTLWYVNFSNFETIEIVSYLTFLNKPNIQETELQLVTF